jgi:hypothetical protein
MLRSFSVTLSAVFVANCVTPVSAACSSPLRQKSVIVPVVVGTGEKRQRSCIIVSCLRWELQWELSTTRSERSGIVERCSAQSGRALTVKSSALEITPFSLSLWYFLSRAPNPMIGSRAWGALMRRNLIYYRRHWLSSVRSGAMVQ